MSASSSKPKINLRSTAVKRIMQEASELSNPDEDDFIAGPLESDIFEWHCTMRGVKGSEYEGGLYHLRILLPPSYPMSAPDIILMTPNGRFELGKKICIDGLTSFHAGSWQPAWGVRTAITGLRSFWMQGGEALSAIGALDYSKEERRRLAKLSRDWICPVCGLKNHELLEEASTTANGHSSTDPPLEGEPAKQSTETSSTVPTAESTAEAAGASHVPPSSITDTTPPEPSEPVTIAPPTGIPAEGTPLPSLPFTTHTAPTRTVPASSTPPGLSPLSATLSHTPSPRPRAIPIWLDATLFIMISLLVVLLARRLA